MKGNTEFNRTEASRKTGLSYEQLRHFERRGILRPVRRGKRVRYAWADVLRGYVLHQARALGCSVPTIERISEVLKSIDIENASTQLVVTNEGDVYLGHRGDQASVVLLRIEAGKLAIGVRGFSHG